MRAAPGHLMGAWRRGSEEKEGSFFQQVMGETLCWVLTIYIEKERCWSAWVSQLV